MGNIIETRASTATDGVGGHNRAKVPPLQLMGILLHPVE